MSFLASIISNFILSLFTKLAALLDKYIRKQADKKKSDKTADEAREKMDKAKTSEEIDESADDTLSGV
jgi:hypothetical protein